ncbi:MAG: glucosaminidase domain-containing protein [Alphaproteobacteria bacterium]
MALTVLMMKNLKYGIMAVAAIAVCLGPDQTGLSTALAQEAPVVKPVAKDAARLPAVRLVVKPRLEIVARLGAPVGQMAGQTYRQIQLATLLGLPGQRKNWRPQQRFTRRELLDISLRALRRGQTAVPPVYLNRFPANLAGLRSAKLRKDLFIKTVLPLVLRANHEVRMERQRMLLLIARAGDTNGNTGGDDGLTLSELAFLDHLAVQYEVSGPDLAELQQRVDVIPASLALAQGAEESGWGSSRFARLGNAVFGQRTFRKGAGLVPLRREQGQRHEVKSFNSLYTSVRAYVWNLNTHFAYEKFRAKRAAFRDGRQPLDSYALTRTLERYSERGQKYIKTIQVIMRANRLHDFDDVELLPETGRRQPS